MTASVIFSHHCQVLCVLHTAGSTRVPWYSTSHCVGLYPAYFTQLSSCSRGFFSVSAAADQISDFHSDSLSFSWLMLFCKIKSQTAEEKCHELK